MTRTRLLCPNELRVRVRVGVGVRVRRSLRVCVFDSTSENRDRAVEAVEAVSEVRAA